MRHRLTLLHASLAGTVTLFCSFAAPPAAVEYRSQINELCLFRVLIPRPTVVGTPEDRAESIAKAASEPMPAVGAFGYLVVSPAELQRYIETGILEHRDVGHTVDVLIHHTYESASQDSRKLAADALIAQLAPSYRLNDVDTDNMHVIFGSDPQKKQRAIEKLILSGVPRVTLERALMPASKEMGAIVAISNLPPGHVLSSPDEVTISKTIPPESIVAVDLGKMKLLDKQLRVDGSKLQKEFISEAQFPFSLELPPELRMISIEEKASQEVARQWLSDFKSAKIDFYTLQNRLFFLESYKGANPHLLSGEEIDWYGEHFGDKDSNNGHGRAELSGAKSAKILKGEIKPANKQVIGSHSYSILSNPNYRILHREQLSNGLTQVTFQMKVPGMADSWSEPKESTLFPKIVDESQLQLLSYDLNSTNVVEFEKGLVRIHELKRGKIRIRAVVSGKNSEITAIYPLAK